MNSDIRVAVTFIDHPKTLALIDQLGYEAPFRLQALWIWAANMRPNGSLKGLSDAEIELRIGWTGEPEKLIPALAKVGFLEGPENARSIHGWMEHNAYAAHAQRRVLRAKKAANTRWDEHNKERVSPPLNTTSIYSKHDTPSPSPSPSPSPKDREPRARGTGGAAPETPGSPSGSSTNSEQPRPHEAAPELGGTNGLPEFPTQSQAVAYAGAHQLCRFCVGMLGKATPAIAAGCCYEHRAVAGPGNQHLFVGREPSHVEPGIDQTHDLSDAEVIP